MENTFFYLRISTEEKNDKQSFTRQDKSLKAYAEKNNLSYTSKKVFKDSISGKTFNREEWKDLESILKKGDTIIFKEISRFTREAENGYSKYMELMELGINLVFLDNSTVSTDYIKQLTDTANTQSLVTKTALEGIIKLLLIVELDRVEKEREILVKRIKDGMEASSKEAGRKKGSILKLNEELKSDIQLYLTSRDITKIEIAKKHKITRVTLDKYIKLIK